MPAVVQASLPKKGTKTPSNLRVEIRKNAERAAFAQHSQRLSRGALLVDGPIAKPGPYLARSFLRCAGCREVEPEN